MKTSLSAVAGPWLLLIVGLVGSPARAATRAAADKVRWHTPMPPFPAQASLQHAEGVGTLHYRTDATGRVVEAHMDPGTGSRVLDEASVRFVETYWRGAPNERHTTVLNYRPATTLAPEVRTYKQAVQMAVAPRWRALFEAEGERVSPGWVVLGFEIAPAGGVDRLRVLAGGTNGPLVKMATAALRQTKMPPIPERVRVLLPARAGGRLELTFSFATDARHRPFKLSNRARAGDPAFVGTSPFPG